MIERQQRALRAYDGNGNVMGYVDMATGAKSATYEYNAFGETIISDGVAAAANPFRFSTKYTDTETGLLYYGFRYYNPSTGRWLSRDPIDEDGSLLLYLACGNDPINQVDYLGEFNTWGHNSLINSAFPTGKVSERIRQNFKNASREVDRQSGEGTAPDDTHQHAMKSPSESKEEARAGFEQVVKTHLQSARELECKGQYDEADKELGMGMHDLMDSVSPAHRGFQQWDGTHGLKHIGKAIIHVVRELWPTPRDRRESNTLLQAYYEKFLAGFDPAREVTLNPE